MNLERYLFPILFAAVMLLAASALVIRWRQK